jgi:O-methyltransferase
MVSDKRKSVDFESNNKELKEQLEIWSSSSEFHLLHPEIADHTLLHVSRCFMLYQLAKYASNKEGDMAEVGVYKGGTARLIAKSCPNKTLHLFDTFSGMPSVDKTIDVVQQGDFSDTSLEEVKNYLIDCHNVIYHQGVFPQTASGLNKEFSLVHVDVDIYDSVISCLDFFYHKLVPGGVLIFDDYEWKGCPGVKKALDKFLKGKPEALIITAKYQCALFKYPDPSGVE